MWHCAAEEVSFCSHARTTHWSIQVSQSSKDTHYIKCTAQKNIFIIELLSLARSLRKHGFRLKVSFVRHIVYLRDKKTGQTARVIEEKDRPALWTVQMYCPYVNCCFFCTVWSTLIRISLTKALVLLWCDNKSDLIWFDLIWFEMLHSWISVSLRYIKLQFEVYKYGFSTAMTSLYIYIYIYIQSGP